MSELAVDVASPWAELCAQISLQVGAVKELADTLKKPRRRQPPAQPVFGRSAATGAFVTGQALILRFPLAGPDQGHFWFVRSIVVGGLTEQTTAAGTVGVYISGGNIQQGATLAGLGLADLRDRSTAMPNVAFYGRGELPLRSNEEVFVIISGGTNGQLYVATLQYEDFEEGSTSQEWGL